jgi:hypothetical protein
LVKRKLLANVNAALERHSGYLRETPRCRPISHDTPPRTVAAICCPQPLLQAGFGGNAFGYLLQLPIAQRAQQVARKYHALLHGLLRIAAKALVAADQLLAKPGRAEIEKNRGDYVLVILGRNKSQTSAVQALHRLLAFILNWYKSHMWATNRFTDSLCISCIIFP